MPRLDGKVAVVTGAGRGQGRAAALRLSEEGARLALTDIDAEALETTTHELLARGREVVGTPGDIVSPDTARAVTEQAIDSYGRIDVLLNNAGIVVANSLDGYSVAEFDRLMHVNCLGQLLMIQRVIPQMRRQRGGSIINVSSVGGLVALPHLAVYSASKAAVLGLTRGVAYECGDDGIRCNAICPGGVDTPMAAAVLESFDDREEALGLLTGRQIFKRFADAGEIAELVVFLASDESSFMTGATIPIEAGHSAW